VPGETGNTSYEARTRLFNQLTKGMASLIILLLSEIAKSAERKKEKNRLRLVSSQMASQSVEAATLSNQMDETLPAYSNGFADLPPSYQTAVEAPQSSSQVSQSQPQAQQQNNGPIGSNGSNMGTCSPYDCRPSIPKHILDAIDWDQEELGPIKPYFRHVMLCVDERFMDWPPEIVNLNHVTEEVWNVCKDATDQLVEDGMDKTHSRIAFNTIEQVGTTTESVKLLIFPDEVSMQVPIAQIEVLADLLASQQRIQPSPQFNTTLLEDAMRVFVCVHNSRDERCGVLGPRILASLPSHSHGKRVIGVGLSHVSGHKWAGNLVVYSDHKARWFGRVHPGNVVSLLEADQVSPQTCRGCFDW